MEQQLQLRKATRQKAKLRLGLAGPSGSGKTYSALLIASGITSWDKIAVIDTENGSGDLNANLGAYNVIPLAAPFTPERYIEAIKLCEKAGMEVIIIDSVSHEWEGKGGCLESNELLGQTKFRGNSWAAWSVTTPKHQKFLEAILTSTCHVITTARSKTETVQTESKKVKKIGMKEIQRDGYEYELTVSFNLDREGHYAVAGKDRTTPALFIDRNPFIITPAVGKELMDWVNSGAEVIKPKVKTEEEILKENEFEKDKLLEQIENDFNYIAIFSKWTPEQIEENHARMFKGNNPKHAAIEVLKTLLISLNAKCKTIPNDDSQK